MRVEHEGVGGLVGAAAPPLHPLPQRPQEYGQFYSETKKTPNILFRGFKGMKKLCLYVPYTYLQRN